MKIILKNINYKLFIALLIMGLCPTIYTTVRVFYLGQLPGEWSFSIAGQLTWVNLIYEIINEAIILPLFYFVGKVIDNKKELENRIKTGLILTLLIYLFLTINLIIFIKPLLNVMATDASLIEESTTYIRLESIANIFSILFQFVLVVLVSLGKDKKVYLLTGLKLVLCMILDLFLISSLKVSLKLGVNGIAITNIIVNVSMLGFTMLLLYREKLNIFNKEKLDFKWIKEMFKIGGISGFESLVRNLFYIVMISRLINVVNEQGTYWVANNFIWGWLLLPVIQLGELIKHEISINKNNVKGYFIITSIICFIWIVTIPIYKPFMKNVLQFDDVDKLFNLVLILLGSYIFYAYQNIFDSIFYGKGKTQYMLYESVITNVVYYGICFILYITNIFKPSLFGIAIMFALGNIFDSVVSFFVYLISRKRDKILN